MEIWKEIKGFEDNYKISSNGRVKSFKGTKERILKTNIKDRYNSVSLYKKGRKYTFLVHRLVAIHFLKKIKNKNIVNHIDENIKNNDLNNLEWCNFSENIKHGLGVRKMLNSRKGNNAEKKVYQFDINNVFIREYNSVSETRKYGFNTKRVSSVCRKETKTHKKFIFSYIAPKRLG